jgi:hypothetical protein
MIKQYILVDHKPQPEPSLRKWARWFEEFGNRRVAETQVGDRRVSTVFLGLDHQFLDTGPPLLFETMIFGPYSSDDYQERCSTWQEAEEQHARAVVWTKRKKGLHV